MIETSIHPGSDFSVPVQNCARNIAPNPNRAEPKSAEET